MTSVRLFRFSENIRKNLSLILMKELPSDYNVSIQSVEVSSDLRLAKVYVTPMNATIKLMDEKYLASLNDHLISKQAEYSSKLAKQVSSKYSPKINFYIDQSLINVDKIDKLLKSR